MKALLDRFPLAPVMQTVTVRFTQTFELHPEMRLNSIHLLELLVLLDWKEALNGRDAISCVRYLLSELNFVFLHRTLNDCSNKKCFLFNFRRPPNSEWVRIHDR
jgi:hypothetical protein